MRRRARSVEKVEELVVLDIDEELRTARILGARVGHREGAWLVRDLGAVGELVRDIPAVLARYRLPNPGAGTAPLDCKRRSIPWSAGARAARVWITR